MKKNYNPGSMSFGAGFLGPIGDKGYTMVADYEKAKGIIQTLLNEGKHIESVKMGLDGDWNCNSCTIWKNGTFHEYDAYECSIWATPIMMVYYEDAPSEMYEVWKKGE